MCKYCGNLLDGLALRSPNVCGLTGWVAYYGAVVNEQADIIVWGSAIFDVYEACPYRQNGGALVG